LKTGGRSGLFFGLYGDFQRSAAALALLLALALFFQGCSLHSGPSQGTASGNSISRTALSTVGTRYAYGGAHPSKGFDCSGLVCWVYSQNGLRLPRTAREQSQVGSAVSKSGLRPGDLVVFKIQSDLHTGIYTGQGKFVHSPSSGKTVRVDKLTNKYWLNKFVAGRRHRQLY
jgi:cell wall-associated NlpC family hydrolase